MSPATQQLHHYLNTVTSLGSTHDMQTIAYVIGGAFLVFAVTGIWARLTSRY